MFLFRLALSLGMTVGQLLHDFDRYGGGVDEWIEWMAYSRIEHFGPQMENWRAGVIASTVANVAPRKRGARALKPSDFMPSGGKAQRQLTPQQRLQLQERAERRSKGKA